MKKQALINDGKEVLIVDYKLHKIGEQKPYFSLCGEIWRADRYGQRIGRDMIACGQVTEDILKAFPDMADMAAMHLSDIDGIPMHAIDNGWYWNGGTKWEKYNQKNLAKHLRITEQEADEIHNTCKTKDEFAAKVTTMFPRWKKEAEKVIEKYNLEIEC